MFVLEERKVGEICFTHGSSMSAAGFFVERLRLQTGLRCHRDTAGCHLKRPFEEHTMDDEKPIFGH